MAYITISEFNQSGISGLMKYAAEVVPTFYTMVLFALFVIVLVVNFINSDRKFNPAFATAGIITAIAAFMMSLIGGLISPIVVAVSIVVAIIGVVLLFTQES